MKLIKSICIILAIAYFGNIQAQIKVSPQKIIKASGEVTDLVVSQDKLFVATGNSAIDIIDFTTQEKIDSINIPKIRDYTGAPSASKIYSLDILPTQKNPEQTTIIFLAQLEGAQRQVHLYQNQQITLLPNLGGKNSIFGDDLIAKVKYADENNLLIGLLSNSAALYNLREKKLISNIKLNTSTFSDFAIANNQAAFANESGDVFLLSTQEGKIITTLKGANKDNVYKIAISKNYVATAGQDQNGGLYNINHKSSHVFPAEFLIYAVGISNSEKYVAYAFTEDSDIAIFDINSHNQTHKLVGHQGAINVITFLSDNIVVSGGDDKQLIFWQLN